MISLNKVQKIVAEIYGDQFPSFFTKSTLRLWSKKGVISRIKVKNGKAVYPDITIIEALTAIRLKNYYTLEEIKQARSYLEFKYNIYDKVTTQSLVRFLNLQKIFIDKKVLTKQVIENINDIKKIQNLTEQLYLENKNKEIINYYFAEFSRAKKEVENILEE